MFCSCGFYLLLSSVFPRLFSVVGGGLSANLECMSETYCTRLAEIQDTKMTQKIAICAQSHNFVELHSYTVSNDCVYIDFAKVLTVYVIVNYFANYLSTVYVAHC